MATIRGDNFEGLNNMLSADSLRAYAQESLLIQEPSLQELTKFLNDLELGKVNKGKKISPARQVKYLDLLHIPLKFFNKSMLNSLA